MSEPPVPSPSALRRPVARAELGVSVHATEAELVLQARALGAGEARDRLLATARSAEGRRTPTLSTSPGSPRPTGAAPETNA